MYVADVDRSPGAQSVHAAYLLPQYGPGIHNIPVNSDVSLPAALHLAGPYLCRPETVSASPSRQQCTVQCLSSLSPGCHFLLSVKQKELQCI